MFKHKDKIFVSKFFHPIRTLTILFRELKKRKRVHVYLITLPHSGRHWLELMIGKFFLDHFKIDNRGAKEIWQQGAFDFTLNLNKKNKVPIIQHHHFPCYFLFRKTKVILLIRDLRDSLVSNYDKYVKLNNSSMPFSQFLRKGLSREDGGKWDLRRKVHLLNSWYKYNKRTQELLVVKYEGLLSSPDKELKRVVSFVGIHDFTEQEIREAVSFASIGNMGKLEKREIKYNKGSGNYVVNKGKAGRWRDYFSEEDLLYFKEYVDKHLIDNFGYGY